MYQTLTLEDSLQSDREELENLGEMKTYKKGEKVVEEGDLFQRVYLIKSGTLSSTYQGYEVFHHKAGDSFG